MTRGDRLTNGRLKIGSFQQREQTRHPSFYTPLHFSKGECSRSSARTYRRFHQLSGAPVRHASSRFWVAGVGTNA